MEDDEIYDVAPTEEKSAGFKNILSHFQEQASKPPPAAKPKPLTKPKPPKFGASSSGEQPELPSKKTKTPISPGQKFPLVSPKEILGAKQVLHNVTDKRASAAVKPAAKTVVVTPKPLPPKIKSPNAAPSDTKTVKFAKQDKENVPSRLSTAKTKEDTETKTIVLIQHGKPGTVVTDSSGKKYRLKSPPVNTGPPPKKPSLPTNIVIPNIKVVKPRANVTASLIDDDELYDDIEIPGERPKSKARPVSLIPEYTEDEELADNGSSSEEYYDECESNRIEELEEEDLYETFPEGDDDAALGYSKVNKETKSTKAPRVVSTSM